VHSGLHELLWPVADRLDALPVRNQIAALPLEQLTQAIAHWEQISIGSFAPLVPQP